MALKQQLLEIFEKNKGIYFSGEHLAKELYVSRNAVWKTVKALKDSGYDISAVTNKGYCLSADNDILSPQSVYSHMTCDGLPFEIEVYESVDSTNNVLKQRASKWESEGKVIIANSQTNGKGRSGRSFHSPEGTGLYMSILLRPKLEADEATYITAIAAVAVAEAVEEVAGRLTEIKWVNDVFLNGKKICGILTEASFDMENGSINYAVLGIGINISAPSGGFPEEIESVAGCIFEKDSPAGTKSKIAALVLENFWRHYISIKEKSFLDGYKKRSMTVGNNVTIHTAGRSDRAAYAMDIDDCCRLIVKTEDGEIKTISSGEVSVKPIK